MSDLEEIAVTFEMADADEELATAIHVELLAVVRTAVATWYGMRGRHMLTGPPDIE